MQNIFHATSYDCTGAKERGELENRVTQLVQEAKDAGNVVIMIDELHTLVGLQRCSLGNVLWMNLAHTLVGEQRCSLGNVLCCGLIWRTLVGE